MVHRGGRLTMLFKGPIQLSTTSQINLVVAFEVYDVTIEQRFLDSNDGTWKGYANLQELEAGVNGNPDMLIDLLSDPTLSYSIDVLRGGEIAVLLQTSIEIQEMLKHLTYDTAPNQTLYYHLAKALLNEKPGELEEYTEGFNSIEEVINYLIQKK